MNDRIERLKTEAAELNVAKGAGRDGLWQIAGALAMVVGVVVAFVAYQLSLKKSDDLDILSLIILALSMCDWPSYSWRSSQNRRNRASE